jgi:hypothetical protein
MVSLSLLGWSKYDTDIVASERDIREATKKMFDEAIPALAQKLDETDISDFFERVLKEDAVSALLLLLLLVVACADALGRICETSRQPTWTTC